jgi:DNA-binding response OmpR family regulator
MPKILVIDDNDLVSMMLREHLVQEGFEAVVAHDANEGFAAAVEHNPDLILLDVQLPDIVGFDLIRIIKNRDDLAEIPIIMITGSARSTEEKVKGFKLGADDYVIKPFETPELIERIRALLRRRERPVSSPVTTPSLAISPDQPTALEAAITTSREATSPVISSPPKVSIQEAALAILQNPSEFPDQTQLPAIAMPFVMAMLAIVLGGLSLAAGETVKLTVAGLGFLGAWIVLVAVIVVTSSISGISCNWRDGNRLLALAGVPILFKMTGALVFALWTTLSPLYFTASPALLWPTAPFWAFRLDLFELWSFYLLWILIRKRSGSNSGRSAIVVTVVWIMFCVLAVGARQAGAGQ